MRFPPQNDKNVLQRVMVTTAGYLSPNPFFAPVKPTFQTAHSRSSPVASNPPPYRRRSLSEKLKSGDLEHEVVIQTPRTPTNSTVTAPARGSLEPSLLDEDNSIVPEDEVASGVHSQSVLYNQATWESSPPWFQATPPDSPPLSSRLISAQGREDTNNSPLPTPATAKSLPLPPPPTYLQPFINKIAEAEIKKQVDERVTKVIIHFREREIERTKEFNRREIETTLKHQAREMELLKQSQQNEMKIASQAQKQLQKIELDAYRRGGKNSLKIFLKDCKISLN